MAQNLTMEQLGKSLDQESYEWLLTTHPNVLKAVENEVLAGRSPEQIRLFVVSRTGRTELAQRCEQAARHAKEIQVSKA